MASQNKQDNDLIEKMSGVGAVVIIIGLLAVFGTLVYKLIEWIVGL